MSRNEWELTFERRLFKARKSHRFWNPRYPGVSFYAPAGLRRLEDVGGGGGCARDGTDAAYGERIAGATRYVDTNHCPNHAFTDLNPNTAIARDASYAYPAFPMYDPSNATPLGERGGSVGTLFNGAMLFSGYGGPAYGPVWNPNRFKIPST